MAGRIVDPTFWSGKRVLVTGHTGFKGSWLVAWLADLGAEVAGLALEPDAVPSIFKALELERACQHHIGDIRDAASVDAAITGFSPDIVIHMAAQPLVRRSYREPVDTFATNVMGTAHVLDACRRVGSVRVVVSVTTDKVYANRHWPWGYRETDHLGGHDPYSASKAAAELLTQSWRDSFLADAGIAVATARAGNVIGGGDFCEDRIIPDAVRAFARGERLVVRNPAAVRPWQLVVEPLAGYLLLAESCWSDKSFADAWNFGPDSSQMLNVGEVAEAFCAAWGRGAAWEAPGGPAGPKEAALLMLDPAKARQRLGWHPRFAVGEALAHTAEWYKAMLAGASARELRQMCRATIAALQAR
jgi:CDP-glucose 4,6-dehydratase